MTRIYTRREVRQRRMRYQVFAGMIDFVAIIVGVLAIIACVILLNALVQWVLKDGSASLSTMWDMFNTAIIIPD